MSRPLSLVVLVWLVLALPGCTSTWLRPGKKQIPIDPVAEEDTRNLVGRYTHAYGLEYVKVEGVSLVTGLAGTGSDPPPSSLRAALLAEMNTRRVENPEEVLASKDTAMVLVKGYLRPGIQEGDHFDIEVRCPARSGSKSLRNGWLLPTRLSELAVLDQELHTGHVLALAEGPLLVDPTAGENDAILTRATVLGGGVAKKARPLGLVIDREHHSFRLSQNIAAAINARFHAYKGGRKQGLATAKTDEFVELQLDTRYKNNVSRYVKVVRSLSTGESPSELQARLMRLGVQLQNPITAAQAALRLEAIGDEEAVAVLNDGLKSKDPEVRFYAAEALAYLDQTSAVEPLGEIARMEPAFRVNALAALSTMDDILAYDTLRSLLEGQSAETRYGAFRSLWMMNPDDPLVRGERLANQFGYHRLNVSGAPMIHLTRSFRPEVVLFGADQHFKLPMVLDAGKNILVNGLTGTGVTVNRFAPGEPEQKRVVSDSVDEVIRAIVELGGTYPDVVQALQQAKTEGALESRLAVDALPEAGRSFAREGDASAPAPEEAGAVPYEVATPLPDLFSTRKK